MSRQIDWDLVRQALEVRQINEKAARLILAQAIGDDIGQAEALPDSKEPVSGPVEYGIGPEGGYTDSADPRQPNARSHSGRNNGPTTSVHTLVLTNPSTPYRCTLVDAYGPNDPRGGGKVVVWVEQDGSETVMLGTGAYKTRGEYDQKIPHVPGQEVVLAGGDAKFAPPGLGPCSIFLADSSGKPISDEVRSLGHPAGDHFSYRVVFSRR